MSKTNIDWATHSWNIITGCEKCSPGCLNCYALAMHRRLRAMGLPKYDHTPSEIRIHENMLDFNAMKKALPKEPGYIFVNSMSDTYHPDVPATFLMRMWGAMRAFMEHEFLVLTKRPHRIADVCEVNNYYGTIKMPSNQWLGATVECRSVLYRIDTLRAVRHLPQTPDDQLLFLSIEPLLENLGKLNLEGINWVIVGGESGHRARDMHIDWIRSIRDQCVEQNIPFFFKQWGGPPREAKYQYPSLDDVCWRQVPYRGAGYDQWVKRCEVPLPFDNETKPAHNNKRSK